MNSLVGTRRAMAIQWRVGRGWVLGWVVGLTVLLVATTVGLRQVYDTPAKIDAYAAAVTSGDALVAINGRVAGVDSLGGIIANEFGFVASFALPLMAMSLLARLTRRDEESGRTDQLAAGRIGRAAAVAAAGVVVTLAIVVTTAVFVLCLVSVGIPLRPAVLYAASLGGLSLCFGGGAALVAQAVGRARTVYAVMLALLAAAYLLRGVGDVLESWLTWLSPLGWAEKTQAFGDEPTWWPLLLLLATGVVGFVTAVGIAGRRDVGSALVARRVGSTNARPVLMHPLGRALLMGRATILGWAAATALVAGVFGAVTRQAGEALDGNPAALQALGGADGTGAQVMVSVVLVVVSLMTAAAALQLVAGWAEEERDQRLEVTLAGTQTRGRWLAVHGVTLAVGVLVVAAAGAGSLALTVAWSLSDAGQVPGLLGDSAAYLPVAVVLAAAAGALFGARPRWLGLAWAWLTVTALLALLGAGLHLPGWAMWASPTEHVGTLPAGAVDWPGVAGLSGMTAALVVVAAVGFRRRDVPGATSRTGSTQRLR